MDQHRFNLERIAGALRGPIEESSDYDLDPSARPAGAVALRPASVLIPLVARGAGLNVVLTRRAARLAHHPGQVAFPGGKQDKSDRDALDAALREAEEEIGLPREIVEILGSFDAHETVTRFKVTPFVGVVTLPFVPRPDPHEVDEVFEVPLAFVLDAANFQVHRRRWNGDWRQYYAIPYGPHYIWGASARMLKTLADRLGDP
jgi:8-oxo-dGTP pyrophosphatase MutT (NUDIX family)